MSDMIYTEKRKSHKWEKDGHVFYESPKGDYEDFKAAAMRTFERIAAEKK